MVLGRAFAKMSWRHAILRAKSVVEPAQTGEAACERDLGDGQFCFGE
jgi:hypothetical protein